MKNKTHIYISGSITHDPNFVKKFALAEKLLRDHFPDAEIFNPAAHQNLPTGGKSENEVWAAYLARDLYILLEMRKKVHPALRTLFLVVLPGSEQSKGVSLERAVAKRELFRIMDIRKILPDWDRLLAEELGAKP